jgi:hypothetical protein
MSLCSYEKEPVSLNDLDVNEFFDNFEKYIDITFQDQFTLKTQILQKQQNIARNLKKEFDFEFLGSEDIIPKTEPIRKIEKNNIRSQKNIEDHNFFCLCFVCQTKKFIQKKRSTSIRLIDKNTMPRNKCITNKENIDKVVNGSTKPSKKNFILKNGKQGKFLK